MSESKAVTPDTLSDVMEFGHVIRVNSDGTVSDSPEYFAGELSMVETSPGTWEDCFSLSEGWELLTGFTGQHGYSGPVMHPSEYIGGGLARHILETPGDYVAVVVESEDLHVWSVSTFTGTKTCESCGLLPLDDEDMESTCEGEPAGWAVAFKPAEDEPLKDHGFIALGKYSRARDSILHFMCEAEWSNGSFGDVEAPTGYVWRISNDPADVHIPNTEVTSLLEEWFTDNSEVTDSPALRAELVGHFLVIENSQGFVSVETFSSAWALGLTYSEIEAIYTEWMGAEDEA